MQRHRLTVYAGLPALVGVQSKTEARAGLHTLPADRKRAVFNHPKDALMDRQWPRRL